MTGKKFSNSLMFSSRVAEVPPPPAVASDKLFANSSKRIRVLSGAKSKT